MKIVKERGQYLSGKQKKHVNTGSYILGISVLLGMYVYFSGNLFVIFLTIFTVMISFTFFGFALNYGRGIEGENAVTKILSNRSDNYYLINDLKLKEKSGNIDHVLVGPNGVFVIETKNYSGVIICQGDKWCKYYEGKYEPKYYDLGSPSKQAKRGAVEIKKLIDESGVIDKSLWVEALVVFTGDSYIEGHSTVPIISVDGLHDYIKGEKSRTLSEVQIKKISNAIAEADIST